MLQTFKFKLRQWVEEVAEIEIEAENREAALAALHNPMEVEIDWEDGTDSTAFEIVECKVVQKERQT
jgi:hypothetical protein